MIYKTLLIFILGIVISLQSSAQIYPAGKSIMDFNFALYEEINNCDNIIFSPYSIYSALSMTFEGAESKTSNEMQSVLAISDPASNADNYRNLSNFISEDCLGIELNIANSLWIQNNYTVLDSYKDLLRKYYQTSVFSCDFRNQTEKSRTSINDWVSVETNKKIKNLIQPGILGKSTRMVLINAIYFKGAWQNEFVKENNRKDFFYTDARNRVQVTFMSKKENLLYFKAKHYSAIEMPYKGRDFSMLIILPHKFNYLKKVEKMLDKESFSELTKAMMIKNVDLKMPKFKYETSISLKQPLSNMGMESAFSHEADFSGITGSKELFIQEVVHKAIIKIDEEGTEASAATGVIMSKSSFAPESIDFKIDHPFLFFIKENSTNTILFSGKVIKPENR